GCGSNLFQTPTPSPSSPPPGGLWVGAPPPPGGSSKPPLGCSVCWLPPPPLLSPATAMPPAPDPAPAATALDRAAAGAEMEQARRDFHRLLSRAAAADLRRPSEGTKWTNQQLLFHMLFGYLVVRGLLVLVRTFGLL